MRAPSFRVCVRLKTCVRAHSYIRSIADLVCFSSTREITEMHTHSKRFYVLPISGFVHTMDFILP